MFYYMQEILKKLDSAYFWDVDPGKLDIEKSRRLIIERVINFGNLEEIRLIREYWGDREIREILCNLNFLDPKTLNFVSLLFDIPKERFKCYIRKQLNPQPWNY
jgi:hypothetical protein